MPQVEINQFFQGNQQDDIISSSWGIIDSKNIDGLRTGYGITLAPKLTNQLTTGVNAMRGFYDRSSDPDNNWVFGDNGTIYNTDGTLLHTLTDTSFDFVKAFINVNDYYFIAKQGADTEDSATKIYKISTFNANAGNWTALADTGWNSSNSNIPPVVEVGGSLTYTGFQKTVWKILDGVRTEFNFPNDAVVGLTLHGTQYKVYSQKGTVYYWDGISASFSSSQELGFRIMRVEQEGNFDYITTQTGDLYQSGGYDYQLITKKRFSNRVDDNTDYSSLYNYTNNFGTGTAISFARGDIYIISSDTNLGLYKYGSMIPGLPKGFNKVITQTNDGTEIDEIYTSFFHSRSNRLYVSYRAGVTYGCDYIDLNTLTTVLNGYFVTQIFRGPPNLANKITKVTATSSYTSGTNYINLYKRINNGDWVLIRNINNDTDVIQKQSISTNNGSGNLSDRFIDIQFKVEFNNGNQNNTPPILHSLELDYAIVD